MITFEFHLHFKQGTSMHEILWPQLVGVVISFDIGFVIRKFQYIFLILECVLSSKLSTYKGRIYSYACIPKYIHPQNIICEAFMWKSLLTLLCMLLFKGMFSSFSVSTLDPSFFQDLSDICQEKKLEWMKYFLVSYFKTKLVIFLSIWNK